MTDWTTDEDERLNIFYTKYNMSIPEIAKIHKRNDQSIHLRLIKNGLIKDPDFIKTEVLKLEKFNRENGIANENQFSFLTQIISKHFLKLNKKIKLLDQEINKFD